MWRIGALVGSIIGLAACGRKPETPVAADWARDVRSTDLTLDLVSGEGFAEIHVAPVRRSSTASFEIGDLYVQSVEGEGGPLDFVVGSGTLHVRLPPGSERVAVTYGFFDHSALSDGWMPAQGASMVWPTNCGNLFPCRSTPADGLRFALDVVAPAGDVVVFPKEIPTEAPSYMVGVATGPYEELSLGITGAGTEVSVWWRTDVDTLAEATQGTAHLLAVFDFLERTYGPYAYGDKVGSVSVDWSESSFGGMEHHPTWHVAQRHLDDENVHAHEAAHGWFGNGVRIACWEDFLLAEGTTSYVAVRALEQVGGPVLWPEQVRWLDSLCAEPRTPVLLDTCGMIDIVGHPIVSGLPYAKGACFFEDVGDQIGPDALDRVLADFYRAHVGGAATMRELLAELMAAHPGQARAIDALASDWLRSPTCPADYATRCGRHIR